MDKTRILFLCTGNSCRSQMAEGWAKHLKGDSLEVESAGTHPTVVNPIAVRVMAEEGVDISGQRSKHVEEFTDREFDYVVTLCDSARETCPIFPGAGTMIHRSFEDPADAVGDEEQVLAIYRRIRDQIREFVESLPDALDHEEQS